MGDELSHRRSLVAAIGLTVIAMAAFLVLLLVRRLNRDWRRDGRKRRHREPSCHIAVSAPFGCVVKIAKG